MSARPISDWVLIAEVFYYYLPDVWELQVRDAHKAKLCNQLGIKLIIVDYTEPLKG
jgi:hypothetical protein